MDFLYNAPDMGTTVKIVGILRPDADAVSSMMTGAIGYTTALTDYLVERTAEMEVLRKQYDYIIVDTTSMFSVLNLALLDISTIVTFLGIVDFIPTIKNMKIGNDTLRTLNYDANKIRLVLNRSDAKTRIDLQDVVRILGENFYHILPNDYESARQSIATGVPLVLSGHDSALARELRNLVGRYTNKGYMEDTPTKSSSWLTKIFN